MSFRSGDSAGAENASLLLYFPDVFQMSRSCIHAALQCALVGPVLRCY